MRCLPRKWDGEADVIIIGSGLAGLAAAIEAHQCGASVTIFEKRSTTGGNSILSGGGVNAVDPERQITQGVEDSVDLHFKQTFEGGGRLGDPEKIRFLVENSLEMCLKWLERIGVAWPNRVVQGFGTLWQRTHLPAKYKNYVRGAALVYALLDQVEKMGVTILVKHKVIKIIREKPLERKVAGVKIEADSNKLYYRARRGVVLASGGFAANREMVADHDRRLANTPTTNHPGATGECIKMAQDIGAEVVGMDHIQCTAMTVYPPCDGHFFALSSKEIRGYSTADSYKIFVNKEGNRFINEDSRRDEIASAAFGQDQFKAASPAKSGTVRGMEEKLGVSGSNLIETIEEYNSFCDAMCDFDFGKPPSLLVPFRKPPFIAETKTPARHYTMGGLKVKGVTGVVVDRWGKAIPGLYAAGEVTGGIHGANRLGNNAIPDCIIFGRIVGKNSARGPAGWKLTPISKAQ